MTRGKKPTVRQLRVGEELRHALAEILGRGDLRDPELRGHSITVTEVRMSADLRRAVAYVVPLGGRDETAVLAALHRAAPYLRGRIARRVRLKFTPALVFEQDTTYDEAAHIDEILRRPEVARDLREGAEENGAT